MLNGWKCSRRASRIAQSPGEEPPHTPIIQQIENMIRQSSTPDVLQTSLSIYINSKVPFHENLPPCLHIVPASLDECE